MFRNVFVAGTFDGLHGGHIALLTEAFINGKKVTIGLTSDEFVRKFKYVTSDKRSRQAGTSKKKKDLTYHVSRVTYHPIRVYEDRKKSLTQWLQRKHWLSRASILPINDPYEPAASDKDVDALVVSSETKKRGGEIDALRKKRGLTELTLLEVPMVNAVDLRPISSTRIRGGEIDASGKLVMPDALRPELQKPLGTVLKGVAITASIRRSFGKLVITVGDVTTETFIKAGRIPDFAIVDHRVGRKPYKKLKKHLLSYKFNKSIVHSGPGFISAVAIKDIRHALRPYKFKRPLEFVRREHVLLEVEGEEDLLALPAIAEAPIGSLVYYGQPASRDARQGGPGRGLVEVVVTEAEKKHVATLLAKFI